MCVMLFIAEKNRNKENTLAPSLNRLVCMLWDETELGSATVEI